MSTWLARGSAVVAAGAAAAVAGVLLHAAAFAATRDAPIVGEAERVVSEVRGIFEEDMRELVVKDNVYSQEVIETATEAATRLIFLDRTELSMGPLSRVTLDRYIYDPSTTPGELVISFISGIFAFTSGLIPASGYDLRTPFANLGIRGTWIHLFVGPGLMQLAVPEGVVTDDDGSYLLDDPFACLIWTEPGAPPVLRPLTECQELLFEVSRMVALLFLPGDIEPAGGPLLVPPRAPPLDVGQWPARPFDELLPLSAQ